MPQEFGTGSFVKILDRDTSKTTHYVRDDVRNYAFAAFLQKFMVGRNACLAVDVGCGSGVQSWALSTFCKNVKAVDRNPENVQLASELAAERGVDNVRYVQGDALALPVDEGTADLVVLNGVLEWVGMNEDGEDPVQRQFRCLAEARRVLRDDGLLYLAIENRWAPCHIRKDPHVDLPMISALPRWMADLYFTALRGRKYQTYIHGQRQLARLLANAGFGQQEFYAVVPDYQYAFAFISLESRGTAMSQLAELKESELQELCDQAALKIDMRNHLRRLRRRARLGVFALTAADYGCVAHATPPTIAGGEKDTREVADNSTQPDADS